MTNDELYNSFYQPLEPVKKEEYVNPYTLPVEIDRDEFGLTLECKNMLKHKLSHINVKDLSNVYPDMSDAILNIWNSIGSPDVKSVETLSFDEFWNQINIGLIRDQDKQSFSYCLSIWKEMTYKQRIQCLSDFKSKYNRGIYISTILKDIIDPYWQIKRQEEFQKNDVLPKDFDNIPFFG